MKNLNPIVHTLLSQLYDRKEFQQDLFDLFLANLERSQQENKKLSDEELLRLLENEMESIEPIESNRRIRLVLEKVANRLGEKVSLAQQLSEKVEKTSKLLEQASETIEEVHDVVSSEDPVESLAETIVEKALESTGTSTKVEIMPESEPVLASEQPKKKKKQPKKEKRADSQWSKHIRPFLIKNWVFVLAPTFIFTGLLLLVFSLWDQATWIRYGLAPTMIVGFSYGLSLVGRWLKKQDGDLTPPVAFLQGIAVFLSPLSLLMVAVLSIDQEISLTGRVIWALLLSTLLLGAWYWIFHQAMKTIFPAISRVYSMTLLFLNSLLLLMPISHWAVSSSLSVESIDTKTKFILVLGFYTGFFFLIWNSRKILQQLFAENSPHQKITLTFYSITSIGTFFIVWLLTHARLFILPEAHTYSPLLILFALLIYYLYGKLKTTKTEWLRSDFLGYVGYFLIILGLLLGLRHEFIRVLSFLLAGGVWLYQADMRNHWVQYHLAFALMVTGILNIALFSGFIPPLFPWLVLIAAGALFLLSWKSSHQEIVLSAQAISLITLAIGIFFSLGWQWYYGSSSITWGIAFLLFGGLAMVQGIQKRSLAIIHTAAAYCVVAVPYLGFADVDEFTLKQNTLVFGLAILGGVWGWFSSLKRFPILQECRSTVLWSIGMMSLSILLLQLILVKPSGAIDNPFLLLLILSGPIFMSLLMVGTGYFSRSQLPVYMALLILVLILPELKRHVRIISFKSGLGSAFSGIAFLAFAFVLAQWKKLRQLPPGDRIAQQKPFPLQRLDHHLFTTPMVITALFLITRVIFWTYPVNLFLK